MTTATYKHAMGATVALNLSVETGIVIGRGEFASSNPQYLLRYVAADGRQVEGWFDEDAIMPAKASTGAADPKKTSAKRPTAAEKKAATEKAAAEMAAQDADAPDEKPKRTTKRTSKPKADTLESVSEAFTAYLAGAEEDEDELALRRENVKAILAHFELKRMRDIKPEDFAAALGHLKTIESGELPEFMQDEDDDGEAEDEDDLV